VPRSLTVAKAELQGKTTIEADPDSDQADLYRNLARGIINNENRYVPVPLGTDELKAWAESWYDRLLEHNKNQDQQGVEPVKNDLKYYDLKPDSASVKVR
jgi:nitrogenase iron protein NifH